LHLLIPGLVVSEGQNPGHRNAAIANHNLLSVLHILEISVIGLGIFEPTEVLVFDPNLT